MLCAWLWGKKNFEKWVKSKQLRLKTNCVNKNQLKSYLIKAGFDANEWGSSIKTHIGKKDFFFWDFIDGNWVAIFSKYDSQEMIQNFINTIESKNGVKIFENGSSEQKIPAHIEQYPTNFKDKDLLIKTLEDYGIKPIVNNNGEIIADVSGTHFRFQRSDSEPYTVELESSTDLKDVFTQLTLIDEDYMHNVQSLTYENLKKNLEGRKNLYIENEEVLEDNSIVITVNIQD